MDFVLDAVELRALGALIEKEGTTPEYYPMTLNGLLAACNQKSNRWPVSDFQEHELRDALSSLRSRGFAAEITGSGRVSKYAQRFVEKLNLGRRETAVLCVLMLRGQQTLGEIKGRTDRLYSFSDLNEVERWLRGEVRPALSGDRNPGTAVTRTVRSFFVKLLGGERRHYQTQSKTFRAE